MIERKRNLRAIRSQERVKNCTRNLYDVVMAGLPWETNTINDKGETKRTVEKKC